MLVRWSPFRELQDLQSEMNRLFSSVGQRGTTATDASWQPTVDIYEDEGNFVIKAELPGLSRDDVELHLENRTLTLKGERQMEKDIKEENYHKIERFYGRFSRSFQLPTTVDQNGISAKFENGVLEVGLPKAAEVRPKRIEIGA